MQDVPTLNELQDFTLNHYIKLLKYLKLNYRIIPFRDVSYESTPYLILRHDIDLSLQDALIMAKIEKDMGVRATYFVLLSTPSYNLLEGENIAILKKISEFGHEIGLHYHPAQYRLYNQNVHKTLKIETQILENYLGKKVRSISRHGLFDRDPFSTTRQYINANHPYLRADLFVHDSDRAWVTLEGLSTLLNNPPKRVQLLIHPDNWQKDKIDRQKLLERHFQNKENEIQEAKKRLQEAIQQDQLVTNYENTIKDANFEQSIRKHVSEYKSNLNRRGLIRYYLLHSRIGWNFSKLRRAISTELPFPYPRNRIFTTGSLPEKTTSTRQPLVSVIITSFNYGRYLSDAIESVLNQTYPNVEIIVIDDGSTDKTREITAIYPVKYDFQIHQGVAVAKNNGIQQSRGDFFICLDGDDKLFPKYVEKTLSQMLKHSSTGFVYTGSTVWNENICLEDIWMPRKLFSKYSLFAGWSGALGPILVRRKSFESLDQGFDPAFPAHEDLDLCFRILSKSWKSDVVYEPIHWYRIHTNSLNPITFERKEIASAFMDSKFWFRKPYRKTYGIYEKILGRMISLMKHPIEYPKAIRKKIQISAITRSICLRNLCPREKIYQLQQELNSTIDRFIEWHKNESLRKYYSNRIQVLELKLRNS